MAAVIPLSASDFLATVNLPADTKTAFFTAHMPRALGWIEGITESDAFEQATDEDGSDDEALTAAFRLGFAFYLLSETVELLNLKTIGAGIVTSTGFDSSRSELLSVDNVAKLRQMLERRALESLQSYLNPQGTLCLMSLQEPRKRMRVTII